MKFNFNLKKKDASIEVDAERLLEKGMEQHERTWKDKFSFRHNAKKEMVDIKHKNKLEVEDKKQNKKTKYQIMQEEKRKNKELEFKQKIIGCAIAIGSMLLFMIFIFIICSIGSALEG